MLMKMKLKLVLMKLLKLVMMMLMKLIKDICNNKFKIFKTGLKVNLVKMKFKLN